MWAILIECIPTIIILIKIIPRIRGNEDLGKFLYHARISRSQIFESMILAVVYALMIFFFSQWGLTSTASGVIALLIPLLWFGYLLWPISVYENGIGYSDGYLLSQDIENVVRKSEGCYILKIHQTAALSYPRTRSVNVREGAELPAFLR